MNEFSVSERLLHKMEEMARPYLAPIRRKKLKNTDFTIISNNCWAGVCYEYFGLQKKSPTIGMYFFADDYIRFIDKIHFYLSKDLQIINADESRYKEELYRRGQNLVLVGVLGDIELILLHYRDKHLAEEKWKRRVNRINWANIIYKFSYMNQCTDEHIHSFESISVRGGVKHFEFVPREFKEYKNAFVVPSGSDGQVQNDTFYWNKYCDVIGLLNL